MMGFLNKWVLNIAALAIFLVLLEIMMPSGKTKKFIRLVSGFIIIIAIINPFAKLLGNGFDFKSLQITESNFLDKKVIQKDSEVLKEQEMKQITEVYRKKLIGQLEESVQSIEGVRSAKADVIINEDYKSDSFGEIKRVYLNLGLKGENNGVKPVADIKKVEINTKQNPVKDEKKQSQEEKKVSDEVRKSIKDLLGVKDENIVITMP